MVIKMEREHLSEKAKMGLEGTATFILALFTLFVVHNTNPHWLLLTLLILTTLSLAIITFISAWNYVHENDDKKLAVFSMVFSGIIIAVCTLFILLIILLVVLGVRQSK